MKTIPTYIIDGILESGKTTFIKNTIGSDDFFKKGKTLVLACEEGMEEYDENFLDEFNTEVKYFENEEDFTPVKILEAINESRPQRVVVELNGMWDLTKIQFPTLLKVYQFISFINYETFNIYFANMRQKMLDVVKQSDVVVFINVKEEDQESLDSYSSSFKLTNNQAQFMIMDNEGRLTDAFPVEPPYDYEADVIVITNDDYGFWYIDTFENKERYDGKEIEMNVMVVLNSKLPKNSFIAGRLAMTCCSNDIQLYGHLAFNDLKVKLKDRSWVHIVALIKYEWSEEYQEEECHLYPSVIEPCEAPENPVLDLTK